jgi:hypothetical protein
MEKLATAKSEKEEELKEIKLKDGLYTSFVEGHR